ncbi:hypothetical protein AMTRI_Chr11g101250 [Amborella trichopoda]
MGNNLICIPRKDGKDIRSESRRKVRSQRKMSVEEELIHRQALAMAFHQHQSQSQRFDGSMSRRISKQGGPGTSSSRRRNPSDSFSNGKLSSDVLDNLETKKFVLVHGEGFGAWCWYKSISLLEEAGFHPIALDLSGSGIDHTDTNGITTLAEYASPLTNFLKSLPENEKVIVVGHSCAGACLSYALEHYPKKISKAIYLSATMVRHGQRPFDVFTDELISAEVFMKESQLLMYGNGKDRSPTGLKLEKNQINKLYFNQSPAKDVALAAVSMRLIPLKPIMESLSLTPENYGNARRFYVQTLEDRALSSDIQEKLVRENPPEGVYKLKGSDHCPFFSKPQSLHKVLLEIAQLR